MSDYLNPNTWRQVFQFYLYGDKDRPYEVPFRMISMEGNAQVNKREVVINYLIPTSELEIVLDHLVPPVTSLKRNLCIIPQFNNASIPGHERSSEATETLKAVDVKWKAHIPDKPVDPYRTDLDWLSRTPYPQDSPYRYFAPSELLRETYGHVVEIRVTYDNTVKKVEADDPWTWLDIRADASALYLAMSGKKAAWRYPTAQTPEDNPNLQNLPITKIVPCTEWSVRWKHIPEEDFHEIMKPMLDEAVGKVNSVPFSKIIKGQENAEDITGDGYKWNVLFAGYSVEEEGEVVWGEVLQKYNPLTVEMKFLEKTIKEPVSAGGSLSEVIGHNHFFNDVAGEWQKLYVNGELVYKEYDFNNLFDCDAQVEEKVSGS